MNIATNNIADTTAAAALPSRIRGLYSDRSHNCHLNRSHAWPAIFKKGSATPIVSIHDGDLEKL